MTKTIMTLDERIHQDLEQLFKGREVSAAISLQDLIDVSTKGLPLHFTGDRESETVLVMLNPGQDAKEANRNFKSKAKNFDLSSEGNFIKSYTEYLIKFGKIRYGEIHKDKEKTDHFDIKQAAFLKAWKGTGIDVPTGFPDDEGTHRSAAKNFLMQKLQLELIPYCSRTFELKKQKKRDLTPLFPFVETMLDEIFKKDRNIVVFCSGLFERVFKAYNRLVNPDGKDEEVFFFFPVDKPVRSEPLKDGGQLHGRCLPVEIRFRRKKQQALIAHTFASQALSKAYKLMERYGEFCFSNYGIAIN